MDHGAIELRSGSGAISERNEEVNRRRMARESGGRGGPLRVTDPAALARLMAEMRAKAEQQRMAEEAREEERRRREGAAYRTPEQRAEAARAARAAAAAGRDGEEEEARVLEKRFDPARDYYQVLGIPRGASAAEVRKAYKRLALLSHPDKYKDASLEQQAAVADRFKLVVEAFDVLSNEEQRAVYDKCRDFMETNPGKGLPVLSPEEAALMRSGLAELARLRRQGAKAVKHAPLEKEVHVSLEKLNSGCTKTVAVERRRVAPDGSEFASVKNIHLVIRRGSREGDRQVFEGDGCEAADTLPGDLVLTLRQKPHPRYRRSGDKDLELFAQALAPGDVLFAVEVPTIHNKRLLLTGSALREAARNGGAGGVWQAVLPGQGMFDAAEPWEQPAGKLTVQLRYPACFLAEARVSTCLRPQPVHLLGCAGCAVVGALAAGSVAQLLNHRLEAEEMAAEAAGDAGTHCDASSALGSGSSMASRSSGGGSSSSNSRHPLAVCLVVDPPMHPNQAQPASAAGGAPACSPAAAAMLRALRRLVPGLQAVTAVSSCVLDDEWQALHRADVIILDAPEAAWALQPGSPAGGAAPLAPAPPAAAGPAPQLAGEEELHLAAAARHLADSGVLELLWQRFWAGSFLVGVGQACAFLGRQALDASCCAPGSSPTSALTAAAPTSTAARAAATSAPPVLPWCLLRAGGGSAGWASLQAALAAAAACPSAAADCSHDQEQQQQRVVGAGVLATGCWVVDPCSGRAELLAAPGRDALVATAAWNAAPENDPARLGLQEAEEEWGFFCELTPQC